MKNELPINISRPKPVVTDHTAPFWRAAESGRLSVPFCKMCDLHFYPPPPRCSNCHNANLIWVELSGRATLKSWTEVHLPTIPGVDAPYTVAEVEAEEQSGLTIVALVVGSLLAQLSTDMPVLIGFSAQTGGTRYPHIQRLNTYDDRL